MRPYRRKYHSTWRTRRPRGMFTDVFDYLKPFIHCTKSVWRLEPPFPLTAKISITALTWFLLLLPMCYFLVPPVVALVLFNYFSETVYLDDILSRLGETCARGTWPNKIGFFFKILDRMTIIFFLYDYYHILKCFRGE